MADEIEWMSAEEIETRTGISAAVIQGRLVSLGVPSVIRDGVLVWPADRALVQFTDDWRELARSVIQSGKSLRRDLGC